MSLQYTQKASAADSDEEVVISQSEGYAYLSGRVRNVADSLLSVDITATTLDDRKTSIDNRVLKTTRSQKSLIVFCAYGLQSTTGKQETYFTR